MATSVSGKELFIRFTASAFCKLLSIYVFSYFPFGFEGRMLDLIVSVPDHCLSFYFSKCNHKLKLNKASSSGHILNEFLKHSKSYMLTAFTKLFNIVFTTGIVPDEWSQGIISPIYEKQRRSI